MIHYIEININKNGVILPVYIKSPPMPRTYTVPINRWIGADDIFVLSHITIQSVKVK